MNINFTNDTIEGKIVDMAKVIYKGKTIAESNDTVKVEGNHYFPLNSIKNNLLQKSELKTTYFWKGEAHYYNLEIEDEVFTDTVWYYPNPSNEALSIKNRIAFYQKNGIQVID